MSEAARVQRIDGPSPELLVLSVYRRTEPQKLIVGFDSTRGRAMLLGARPVGAPADSFVMRLRKLLDGSLVRVEERDGRQRLRFEGRIDAVLAAETRELVLRDLAGKPLAGRRRFATRADEAEWAPCALDDLEHRATDAATRREPHDLERQLRALRRRVERKVGKIRADAARADDAPALRDRAAMLLGSTSRYVAGNDYIDVERWDRDPPERERWPIDPRLGPHGEAERAYQRAKKLERGATIAAERLIECDAQLAAIAKVEAQLEAGAEPDTLGDAWRSLGLRVTGAAPASRAETRAEKQAPRKPYRRFIGSHDRAILVGRSSRDNDELTLRHARPHDLWLHVRGRRGAHVVVPLDKGEACPPELLADAAMLAAHYSDASREDVVEVQHALRRHVHKRRGTAAGAVFVEREKVIALRRDEPRLRKLLSSEQ